MTMELWAEIRRLERSLTSLQAQMIRTDRLGARVYNTSSFTVNNSTATKIEFDTERFDDGGFWDSGNPTRLTIPLDGIYVVSAFVKWPSLASGRMVTEIVLSVGSVVAADERDYSPFVGLEVTISTIYKMTASEYVELNCWQNSGANVNMVNTPEFSIARIG